MRASFKSTCSFHSIIERPEEFTGLPAAPALVNACLVDLAWAVVVVVAAEVLSRSSVASLVPPRPGLQTPWSPVSGTCQCPAASTYRLPHSPTSIFSLDPPLLFPAGPSTPDPPADTWQMGFPPTTRPSCLCAVARWRARLGQYVDAKQSAHS